MIGTRMRRAASGLLTTDPPGGGATLAGFTTHVEPDNLSSVDVDVPVETTEGDLLVLAMVTRNNTFDDPTGWTKVIHESAFADTNITAAAVYVRTATSSEPASYTITGSNLAGLYTMSAVSGANTGDSSGANSGTDTVDTVTIPAVNVTANNSLVVVAGGVRTSTTVVSAPTAEQVLLSQNTGGSAVTAWIGVVTENTGEAGPYVIKFGASHRVAGCAAVLDAV